MSDAAIRVLIVAENASTRFGGEAMIPYLYFRLLRAKSVDAHLIVHARTRDELKSLLADDLDRIHFIDDQILQKIFYRMGKLLPHRVAEASFGLANQLLTQWVQRRVIRRLTIDRCVVHQPTPVSPRFPSLLYDLDAPVVIGPLNGGMAYPPAFRGMESHLSQLLIAVGRSLTDLANAVFPGKRRAAVVLVANRRTRDALPSHLAGRIMEVSENAVDTTLWLQTRAKREDDPVRFVFLGRLVDWKALDIVIEALVKVPRATLDVVGDGPMMARWRELAHRLGVAPRVRFLGWRTQAECADFLQNCCALVLPSLYECGGAAVLEAMAMARPVIATAWGGPMDYLDNTCGFLIEPMSRAAMVQGFSSAMDQLMGDPELSARLGDAGRARLVREFDWQAKITRMMAIYESCLGD